MAKDWTNLYKKYKGQWVALADDEVTVIAAGSSAKEALKKAEQKGVAEPILFRVPIEIVPYIGSTISPYEV